NNNQHCGSKEIGSADNTKNQPQREANAANQFCHAEGHCTCASGFEHSIANMFMIPMGIVIRDFASPEFWTAVGSAPENFSHLTVMNFITDNLIPVTIGNIIGGGLLVGLTYWVIYLCENDHH
ncbi:formate/nitrite transporter family protein, partial [Escherichia coli]